MAWVGHFGHICIRTTAPVVEIPVEGIAITGYFKRTYALASGGIAWPPLTVRKLAGGLLQVIPRLSKEA